MLEDCEEFISLTLRTRHLKKPLGMLERNWKHQWLPLCLARHARKARVEKRVEKLMISSQNLRVSWKSVNPHDCVWKNFYRITMRIISQEEVTLHCSITIWYTIFPMPQAMKMLAAKAAVDKEWEKLEKIPAWNLTKVRSTSEVIVGARTKGKSSFLPHWWTSVIWRMPNWSQSTTKTKVESYSEATLWKMILVLVQYLHTKDHQHLKLLQQKSWISYPDCQVAQDKQRTQYLPTPR